MISNRQGGRRRGRGGQRSQNVGQPGGGRQDNRQRGNAAQLLEKYKNMARDAQLAGDRVQMEYYLQYADHYFRVLDESRARYEEQRRQRGGDSDDDEEDEEVAEAADEQASGQDRSDEDRPQRRERLARGDRGRRFERDDRGDGDGRNGARRGNGRDEQDERIAFEALPPAIGAADAPESEVEDEAPQPRRRARRPRAQDSEGEVAPAA